MTSVMNRGPAARSHKGKRAVSPQPRQARPNVGAVLATVLIVAATLPLNAAAGVSTCAAATSLPFTAARTGTHTGSLANANDREYHKIFLQAAETLVVVFQDPAVVDMWLWIWNPACNGGVGSTAKVRTFTAQADGEYRLEVNRAGGDFRLTYTIAETDTPLLDSIRALQAADPVPSVA